MIVRTGQGALLGEIDIKSAYRIVPIHPNDRDLLGMKWRNQYFVDLALLFGLRSAPNIFNTLAELLEWILLNNYNVPDILHYLDDFFSFFFTLGSAGSNDCAKCLLAIDQAAKDTGIPHTPEKCEDPSTRLVFLGIELDSVQMIARLPLDKLHELMVLITQWVNKKWCKPKELQSLVGKLNHASSVVVPGRTFLHRISATHIPCKTNTIADALSRFNLQEFSRLAPHAKQSPVEIPDSVQARLTCNL